MFSRINNIPAPSEAQKERMRETLNYHLGRLECEGTADRVVLIKESMMSTLRRMDAVEQSAVEHNTKEDLVEDVSFSDTFSESFLSDVQAAAEGLNSAPSGLEVPSRVRNNALPPRKTDKRRANEMNLTPIHGIRRKATMRAHVEAGNKNSDPSEFHDEHSGREEVKQLDLSVDLFE